ncbi:hypothetical protein PoB_002720000 [Plakobranchus ocellatus]|uniref:Uncharacterized protein n=1 Tax=Plakobranchus ocellatus TaxID=259542 RepID=A0AAV3ZZT3_9GAST|nr:hypothetical protein PoB_002720000 [Plakobranchus ocellatus]
MFSSVVQVLSVAILLLLCAPFSSWAAINLEHDCAQSAGSDRLIVSKGVLGQVKPYLELCWDVEKVVACWEKKVRVESSLSNGYAIGSNGTFPDPKDIRRAYYIFCAQKFLTVEEDFTDVMEERWCDYDAIQRSCEDSVSAGERRRLSEAKGATKRLDWLRQLTCEAMHKVLACKRFRYSMNCLSEWETIMDMELAKLGP